ncbi:hypothetical protein SASPL_155889 [Salvia splendens]|uniref:Uncharacterized protein n=1 Tax=Salvia splendens TaxID=180675 RepID=A0A8X8VXP2_SALSN|nr:hypothetical protein SASPL_155889 [Salvia splendens]
MIWQEENESWYSWKHGESYEVAESAAWNEERERKGEESVSKDSAGLKDIPAVDAAWLRSLIASSEKEQTNHAISRASFRGFLARKALRALRGLVKLQALVRGYLDNKQAPARLPRPENPCKRFPACFDPPGESLKIVEIDTCRVESRSRRMSNDDHSMSSPKKYVLDHQDFDWGFRSHKGCKSVDRTQHTEVWLLGPGHDLVQGEAEVPKRPKQRLEPGPRRRMSLNEIVGSRK